MSKKFQACKNCGVKKDKHKTDKNACSNYEHNEYRLFLGTTAAKESLTLTSAYDTGFGEFQWSPSDHEQMEGRCHGRTSDPHGSVAYYLAAVNTIDEYFLEIQDKKRANIKAILDGEKITEVDMLAELLKKYS